MPECWLQLSVAVELENFDLSVCSVEKEYKWVKHGLNCFWKSAWLNSAGWKYELWQECSCIAISLSIRDHDPIKRNTRVVRNQNWKTDSAIISLKWWRDSDDDARAGILMMSQPSKWSPRARESNIGCDFRERGSEGWHTLSHYSVNHRDAAVLSICELLYEWGSGRISLSSKCVFCCTLVWLAGSRYSEW